MANPALHERLIEDPDAEWETLVGTAKLQLERDSPLWIDMKRAFLAGMAVGWTAVEQIAVKFQGEPNASDKAVEALRQYRLAMNSAMYRAVYGQDEQQPEEDSHATKH